MSDNDVAFLMSMGFSLEKCQKALKVNGNNISEAAEWLINHGNEPDEPETTTANETESPSLKLTTPASDANASAAGSGDLKANSFKCDECGKLFRNENEVTFHAGKTGHESFSESVDELKPKTKEELEEQKRKLSERLVKIRLEKQEKERQDSIEQEKNRRKQGRQINEIKQKFHEDELKRIAEEKRREKIADAAYKQKLREQIAKDREDFKKAQNKDQTSDAPTKPIEQPVVTQEKRDYDECRIQIRLTDGSTLVQKFKAKEPLASVRLWIEMNRKDGNEKFNIMQTFPRKVFTDEEMMKSLIELGLVPATSLVITKA